MKKLAGLVSAVFLFSGIVPAAGAKIIFTFYGNCLKLAENSLTDQSSQNKIFFEAKAAVLIHRNFYVWASHGVFPLRDSWTGWESKNSFDKDISVDRTLSKRIVAGGLGCFAGYLEQSQMAVRAEVGICGVTNTIDSSISDIGMNALIRSEQARQAGIGLQGNLAFTYGLYKNLFAEIAVGYTYAADTVDDVRSSLGGLQAALGLGIQL